MVRRFNTTRILELLIDNQLDQVKKLTLEGLTDVYFEDVTSNLPYHKKLFSVGSEDLDSTFEQLAHRVCSVVIRILSYTKMSLEDRYVLAVTYRKLFTPED